MNKRGFAKAQFAALMKHWLDEGPALFNAYYSRKYDVAQLPKELLGPGFPKTTQVSTIYRGTRLIDLSDVEYEEYVTWCCVVAWQRWSNKPKDFFDLSKTEQYRVVQALLLRGSTELVGGWMCGDASAPTAISRSLTRIRRHVVEDVHES